MYYVIVSRACPRMLQELATALGDRKEICVILDRRYGERRSRRQRIIPDRRRADRRRDAGRPSAGGGE